MSNIFGERFRQEVERLGGPTTVSNNLGMNRNTIYNRFEKGNLTAEELVQFREIGGDVEYVLSGAVSDNLQLPIDECRHRFPIDMELLEIAIEAAAICMKEKRVELPPEKHAKLISLIYELYMDDEEPKVNTAQIIRLVDLAS